MTKKRGDLTAELKLTVSIPENAMENIYGDTPH